MAGAIFPDMAHNQPYSQRDAHLVFDEMISKGNRVAATRKTELAFLDIAFQEFAMRIREQELRTPSRSSTVDTTQTSAELVAGEEQQQQQQIQQQTQEVQQQPAVSEPVTSAYVAILPAIMNHTSLSLPVARDDLAPSEDAGFFDSFGISSDAFLNILNQMDSQDYSAFGNYDCFY
jgi:hypothetical protein